MIKASKPWAIYTRVSTDDQAREGVSLEVQRLACVDLLRVLGHPAGDHYQDAGHSAKNLQRPAAEQMLARADAGELAGVIVYKLDRLTRSVPDLFDLLKRFDAAGVALVSVREQIDTSSAMGRFFVGLIGLIAQWEREQISERVTAGMNHRKVRGGFIGGPVPVGLLVEGDPGSRVLVPDPERGPIVAQIWGRVIAGASLNELGIWLAEQGVMAPKGVRLTSAGVLGILRSERYVGHLIDRATFDHAGAILTGRSAPGKRFGSGRNPTRQQTHTERWWPLSGLAKCGRCGSALVGVTATNASGTTFPYLRCSGRVRKGKGFCNLKDQPAEVWEGLVVEFLIAAVQREGDLLPALARLQTTLEQEAGPLRQQQADLRLERDAAVQRVRNLGETAAAGGAVARALAGLIAEAQEKVEEIDGRLASLEGRLAGTEMSSAQAEILVRGLREKVATLPDQDLEQQTLTLREVLANVTITPAESAKEAGQVDLAINLPRAIASSYRTGTMVDLGSRQTNQAVTLTKRLRQPSLREWRSGLTRPPSTC